ncbi:MAG TPA: SDR family NAD(P)-dependent oxidoreductase [Xanthobacteraceae bacterium]|nr:SDR family NAD(P)-dependent oxidoreductase [Xanthobacteraceae bacterium]
MNLSQLKAEAIFDVTDLVTVITGGATGLGKAFAEVMAANGARVVLLDRNPETLAQTRCEFADAGLAVDIVTCDVTERQQLKETIDTVAGRHQRLDVVFANAGISAGPGFLDMQGQRDPEGAIENIPDELWDRVIATNLTSVFSTIQAAAPHMKRQSCGRIIVTASIAGLRPGAIVGSPYQISKAGAAHLVKQAALELARYGVTVNAIAPGPFLTSLTTPELEQAFRRGSPSHRAAETSEIQGLALFLASSASKYVTGTHMVIDGGAMLGRAD